MPKRFILLSLAFLLATTIVIMAMPGIRQNAVTLSGGQPFQVPSSRVACVMAKSDGTPAKYSTNIETGFGFYTYFDPAVECAATPTYPFEITALSFMLIDFADVGTATVDIVVRDMADPDSICAGPGAELCRTTVTVTTFYPSGMTYSLPNPCCVNGPFFIGVEYPNATLGSTPSVMMDNSPVDTCIDWMRYTDANFYEFYDFWTAPVPGDPLFYVHGQTQSADCGQVPCTWQNGDPYKMHFPQLPDEAGWDVNATQPMVLADDFMCTETGPIKDIHFWGSWKNGVEGDILYFVLSLHEDIPVDTPTVPYSRPGATLWEREVSDFTATPITPTTTEGWYDPSTGDVISDDHQAYFQYDICFDDSSDWFYQDSGTTYWLNISAVIADTTGTRWGWKSTQNNWNDKAVWAYLGELIWTDIWDPGTAPVTNDFYVQVDSNYFVVDGGGSGYYGDGWYFYQDLWWNIWFRDLTSFNPGWHTLGSIDFDAAPLYAGLPCSLDVAVNWSTPAWDGVNFDMPPDPYDNEDLNIGRQILLATGTPQGHYSLPYEITGYSPAWVSVDVRGYNFDISNGTISHAAQGKLDLAFVITTNKFQPPDSGACCYDPTGGDQDASCIYTTQTECEQTLGGVYEGTGVPCTAPEACCLPNGDCIMADPLCCTNELGGTPQGAGSQCTQTEACCMPDGSCQMLDPVCCSGQGGTPQGEGTQCTQTKACCMPDGSCQMLDPLCCEAQGGTPQGAGTQCTELEACCLPGGNCLMADPLCCLRQGGTPQGEGTQCTQTEACCMPDGSCQMLDPACCSGQGGMPQGPGSQCTQPEACCMPGVPCRMLDPLCCLRQGGTPQGEGTQCTQTEACCMPDGSCEMLDPVCCSSQGGMPQGQGSQCTGPEACCMPDGSCQMLAPLCCSGQGGIPQGQGSQCTQPEACCTPDGFCRMLDPLCCARQGGMPQGAGSQCTQAVACCLPGGGCTMTDSLCCDEMGGTVSPYATSCLGDNNQNGTDDACEATCDCNPGDANNDMAINIGDGVYIISYIFKGGPPPAPYALCSGDANCDCAVNIADAVYLINYIFKSGPPPCDCQTWLSICGPPLRK